MKRGFILLLMFIPLFGWAQERGIGIRLGEPISVTYKDYIEDFLSYEVMVGGGGINSSDYYRKDFESNPPNSSAIYLSHAANRGVSINFRMALHEDITDVFEIEQGYLLGYAGAGVQIRSNRVEYSYVLAPNVSGNPVLVEERSNFDFGPEAFAGAEYFFDETPISIFAEIGLFIELIDRINLKGQGGVGVRYLF